MLKPHLKITIISAFLYWIPACLVLIDSINGSGSFFPHWLSTILLPGYFLGMLLAFGGGSEWAFLGQFGSLFVLLLIARIVAELFRNP